MLSFFKKDNFEHDKICVIDNFLPEPIYRDITDYAFSTNSFIPHTHYTPMPGWKGFRTAKLENSDFETFKVIKQTILTQSREFFKDNSKHDAACYLHYSLQSTMQDDFHHTKYHLDTTKYAGVIYLCPNDAPKESGTAIFDPEKDEIIKVDNVFNRLVMYPSNMLHAPISCFGDNVENSRMTFTFFIDVPFAIKKWR